MSNAIISNIDTSNLTEQQRNALLILANIPVGDVNALKQVLKLSDPGKVGATTLNAFTALCAGAPVNLDLSNAGVNQFKTRNGLGNSGALAGAIGPQTAAVYYSVIMDALNRGGASASRHINQAGLEIVKEFEGYQKLIPGTTSVMTYVDPVGVKTIGWGHTGPDVTAGLVITMDQALALLRADLATAEEAVSRLVAVALKDNQFSALVSFVFNEGEGQFGSSTLLRLLNAGDYAGAADQFGRWVMGGGQSLPGLVRRRDAERALFLT